jgi:UPF0755 protein
MEDINKNNIPEPGDDTPIEEVTVPAPGYFTTPGNLGEDVPPEEPIAEELPAMTGFFTPADNDLTTEAEEVDVPEEVLVVGEADVPEEVLIAEDVEVPEDVLIAESPAIPEPATIPAVIPVQATPEPQPEAHETEPVVLGPAYEESYIPAELLQNAGIADMAPAQPPMETEPKPAPEAPVSDAAFWDKSEDTPEFAALRQQIRASRPPRKGRPGRKKGDGLLGLPHLAATVIWLAIIITIGVTLGKVLWVCAADVLAFGRENKIVTVNITEQDKGNIDVIANKLQEAGLIKYPGLFKFYANLTNASEEITTGSFQLNTNYDYHALVNGMSPSSAAREVIEVLIPEGYNCRQIFALLEANNVCSVASLEDYAANGEFRDFWFLENIQRGDKYCLEGFLFPDTYEFYVNSTPREALGKMLIGFDTRFTEEMQAQLPALNQWFSAKMRENGCSEEFIAQHQIGIRELVTIASMIEEETAGASESPNIASVIYNRLSQDQIYERYLNIDAAIFYALGEHKEALTSDDLKIDSPYNTYTHAGLTPTPISNPGLASLEAALKPADTKYYYYVLNPDTEKHVFSKTLEEHEKLVEKYRKAAAAE